MKKKENQKENIQKENKEENKVEIKKDNATKTIRVRWFTNYLIIIISCS